MYMRHFLLVGDEREVLGVWEVKDEVSAARLRLQLALSYPGCKTVIKKAKSFEEFKEDTGEYDLSGVVPEHSPA